ncbi:MAG: P-loop NTPase [Nitrospinota bacterium]
MKRYKDIVGDAGSNIIGQVSEQQARLAQRLASVEHVVAVVSGKGGVGKSVLTVNLATALAEGGLTVGIVDADINGPAIAKMTGLRGRRLGLGEEGIEPPIGPAGLRVMSMDLLLPAEAAPVIWETSVQSNAYVWRETMEMGALREFLADTRWGRLDFLFADLPPGADRVPNIVELLPQLSGLLFVTVPSEVSQLAVKRSLSRAQGLGASILGVVENMAGYFCRECGKVGPLFEGGEAVRAMAEEAGVPYLGAVPFDPEVARSADAGAPHVLARGKGPAAEAMRKIAETIRVSVMSNPSH